MFRPEVSKNLGEKLSGDLQVAVPVSWYVVSTLIFIVFLTAIIFASLASYSRVEIVSGKVIPDKGLSLVLPTRNGTIERVSVRDGQQITAGTQLAQIRAEEDSVDGASAEAQIIAAIGQQDTSLVAQIAANDGVAQAQIRQAAAQKAGLSAEINQLQSQIALQHNLIKTAQADYSRASKIAERGFVSQRDLQVREEVLLARQQSLSQLTQSLAAKRSSLAEVDRSAAQIIAQAQVQNASLSATRAQVAQQAASTAGARSYALRAPVAGKITALTARVGQPANPQEPLMTIVPTGSILRAELTVPSSAIGFIKPGQDVRLAIDAFPYQSFGTVKGKVLTVAESAITVQGPNGAPLPAYPVMVKLSSASVSAYGRNEPLVPGMTLTARIITEKQSLLEWLFKPLFAVQRR